MREQEETSQKFFRKSYTHALSYGRRRWVGSILNGSVPRHVHSFLPPSNLKRGLQIIYVTGNSQLKIKRYWHINLTNTGSTGAVLLCNRKSQAVTVTSDDFNNYCCLADWLAVSWLTDRQTLSDPHDGFDLATLTLSVPHDSLYFEHIRQIEGYQASVTRGDLIHKLLKCTCS